jgi:hypothetical protein
VTALAERSMIHAITVVFAELISPGAQTDMQYRAG